MAGQKTKEFDYLNENWSPNFDGNRPSAEKQPL